MRSAFTLLLSLVLAVAALPGRADPDLSGYSQEALGFWKSLTPRTGQIDLPGGKATLEVPANLYYLDPQDAERVLVDAWGNPPGQADGVLGMLFPADYTPLDDGAWGVTIEFIDEGYVDDEGAADLDYDDMLESMQADTEDANADRVQQGYEPVHLVGWATPPSYDADAHKLHWAKELQFGDDPNHTLNYNIRVLGREGTLLMNFIAGMNQLPDVEANRDAVLASASFTPGHRYADFRPDMDKVAAYGIGALIAGKVAAKTGLIAAALIFLKKFGVLALAALGGLFGKLFGKKS